jgi:hypothetical protein
MASADTDFYSDDPDDFDGDPQRRKLPAFLAFLLLLVGGTYFVQTTLAANISLNTGSSIEFGQGITATTACSGATNLTITPYSSFTNASGAGAFYFSSVKVSNIPTSCYGVDFTINAYDNTGGSPLALFNSTSANAVVYNNSGTFSRGIGSTGMTVASGSGTFTATFTVPVAQSSNVFKLTIQSGANTPYDSNPSYVVGNVGPGGGIIYYVNLAGFSCGATYTNTGSPTGGKCNYLEVAPSGWNTGSDPAKPWATGTLSSGNAILDIATIPNRSAQNRNELSQIGLGYKYSIDIVTQNGLYNESSNNYAAGAARAYTGGSKSDWYLPTASELNQLCRWARGVAPSETDYCTGGSINSATYGASSAGFEATEYYWSSNEYTTAGMANIQSFSINGQYSQATNSKNTAYWVRPIRAF